MADPRLTINNLSGSKGGLIIDKAYVQFHDRIVPNITGSIQFQDFALHTDAKENQDFMYYYKINGTVGSSGNSYDVNFLFQPIKFIKPYDTSIFFIGPASLDHLYQNPLNLAVADSVFVRNDSITSTEDGGLGYLYVNFKNFIGENNFTIGSDSSKIDKFHSSFLVNNFKGKKISPFENPGNRDQYLFSLETKKFYYIKIKPSLLATDSPNPDRTWEFIISFPEVVSTTIAFGYSMDRDTFTIYDDNRNGMYLNVPKPTAGTSNAANTEVYELPLLINEITFSGARETQEPVVNSFPVFGEKTITWTFNELNESDRTCTAIDLNLVFRDPGYYIGSYTKPGLFEGWTFHYNRSINFILTKSYTNYNYSMIVDRTGSIFAAGSNTALPWVFSDTQEYSCVLKRSGNKIILECTNGNPRFDLYTEQDAKSCTIHTYKSSGESYYYD